MIIQFSNFIRTSPGSIPFSSNFGSVIKGAVQMKYSGYTHEIILEEITEFLNSLSSLYNQNFKLIDLNITEVTKAGSTLKVMSKSVDIHLKIDVILQINKEEPIKITLI